MRYALEHKARTWHRIVGEAALCLRQDGPQGVRLAELMQRQGLTHGGFYTYFASKDDLIAQAIDVMFSWAIRRFALCMSDEAPQAGLQAYIDYYLHWDADGDWAHDGAITAVSCDVTHLEEGLHQRFETGFAGLQRLVATAFVRLDLGNEAALAQATVLLTEIAGALHVARTARAPAARHYICAHARAAILSRLHMTLPAFAGEVARADA